MNRLEKIIKEEILAEGKEHLVDYFLNTWSKNKNTIDTLKNSSYLRNKYGSYLTYGPDEWNSMSEEDLLKIWNAWDIDYTSTFNMK
ncbi:unnamed protein product [marine sediment metagenome]|uniref:Uncharacterized protein n=1 Tax=marine sediment metagenome TaxID=412755 RepID=X1B783_9ZZZZ